MKLLLPLLSLMLYVCSEAKPAADVPDAFIPFPGPEDLGQKIEMPRQDQETADDQIHLQGDYGRYGPQPNPGVCRDKKNEAYCQRALKRNECHRKNRAKRCTRTCGVCTDETICEDVGFNCYLATPFKCSLHWFAPNCKKSCGLCHIKTTKPPITTTTEAEECVDLSDNCQMANDFRCSSATFKMGCQKSCGVCTLITTSTISTTSSTTPKKETTTEDNCLNKRDDCNGMLEFYCEIPIISEECQKFCGKCNTGKTTTTIETTSPTGLPTVPTGATKTTLPLTSTIKAGCSTTTEPTTTTSAQPSPSTSSTTMTTTSTTTEPSPATSSTTTNSPSESGALETTPEVVTTGADITGTETVTTQPQVCADTDPNNCRIWENLGLCYNSAFEEDMKKLCPLSCQVCKM